MERVFTWKFAGNKDDRIEKFLRGLFPQGRNVVVGGMRYRMRRGAFYIDFFDTVESRTAIDLLLGLTSTAGVRRMIMTKTPRKDRQ